MSSRVCRSDGTAVVWHEKSCGSVRMHGEGVTALVHGNTVQIRADARQCMTVHAWPYGTVYTAGGIPQISPYAMPARDPLRGTYGGL